MNIKFKVNLFNFYNEVVFADGDVCLVVEENEKEYKVNSPYITILNLDRPIIVPKSYIQEGFMDIIEEEVFPIDIFTFELNELVKDVSDKTCEMY
jgi:hypothetical protein